jgi:hypothetical protein
VSESVRRIENSIRLSFIAFSRRNQNVRHQRG